MGAEKVCQSCGKTLRQDTPRGLCPVCLMKVGLGIGTATANIEAVAEAAPPTPAELAPHFPQLEILECLGRGGMGVVYWVRQPNLNRFAALKILAPEKVAEAKFAERFSREAQALARLNHPNVVTVYDFGQVNGLYYLLMEYVEGVSLRTLLREHTIKPAEALAIVPKICEALQYAHDLGIVHRDIKPENIMLDKQGRVKITDFGLAKLVGLAPAPERLTESRDVMGTPHYMAPEQVERPAEVDHRADIYSLGVVFYELLTGELPLGKFPLPSTKVQVDVRLDEVVLRTLEKEPERRYQHASEVKTAVEMIGATAGRRETTGTAPSAPFARLALGLFLAGTLGTLALMTVSSRHELALMFGGLALVLALVFGLLSWGQRLGKAIALTIVALGIMAALLLGLYLAKSATSKRARAQALQAQADALQAALRQRAEVARQFEREALMVQLRQAETELARASTMFKEKTVPENELQKAEDKVRLLQAQLAGDQVQIAEVKLAAAERAFATAAKLHQAKFITDSEMEAAKMALELSRIEWEAARAASGRQPTFGPVIERTINSIHAETNDVVDFDTGKVASTADFPDLPAGVPRSEAIHQRMRQRGWDAMGDRATVQGLRGFDMVALPVYADQWEQLAAAEVGDLLRAGKLGTPALMSEGKQLPSTYIIQTREGGQGLLQIIALTDKPSGVKIRYKLVQRAKVPSAR